MTPQPDTDQLICDTYPTPIAAAWNGVLSVATDSEALRLLLVLPEVVMRTVCAFMLADYLRGPPVDEVEALIGRLERPSLGHWAGLLREVLKAVGGRREVRPFMPEAMPWFLTGARSAPSTESRRIDHLIEIRNRHAHGSVSASPEAIGNDVRAIRDEVRELLRNLSWLSEYHLLRVLSQEPTRQGGSQGRIQVFRGGQDLPRAEEAHWDGRLLRGAVYLLGRDRDALLEVGPFIQVRLLGATNQDRLFLFKSVRPARGIRLVHDPTGVELDSTIRHEDKELSFDAWLDRRFELELFQDGVRFQRGEDLSVTSSSPFPVTDLPPVRMDTTPSGPPRPDIEAPRTGASLRHHTSAQRRGRLPRISPKWKFVVFWSLMAIIPLVLFGVTNNAGLMRSLGLDHSLPAELPLPPVPEPVMVGSEKTPAPAKTSLHEALASRSSMLVVGAMPVEPIGDVAPDALSLDRFMRFVLTDVPNLRVIDLKIAAGASREAILERARSDGVSGVLLPSMGRLGSRLVFNLELLDVTRGVIDTRASRLSLAGIDPFVDGLEAMLAEVLVKGYPTATSKNEEDKFGYVKEVVSGAGREVKSCYEARLKVSPTLQGRAEFSWVITRSGRVRDVRLLSSSLNDDALDACLVGVLEKTLFPASSDEITAVYPFILSTE